MKKPIFILLIVSFMLIVSFICCQKETNLSKYATESAAEILTGLTQEIPFVLICGYNELRTKVINDTTIQYQIEMFKGWQNKHKIRKGNAIKFYPKITDPQNRGFDWISYRSIEKKDTIIAHFAYDSAGIFVSGQFSIKSKIEPFECNEFWKK